MQRLAMGRWLPVLVAAGTLAATAVFWQRDVAHEREHVDSLVRVKLASVVADLAASTDMRVRALQRLASRSERPGGTPRARWESDAAAYLVDPYLGFDALAWIDPSLRVRWLVPDDASGPASEARALLADEGSRAVMTAARAERAPRLAPSIRLPDGRTAIVLVVPIPGRGETGGFIAATFPASEVLGEIFSHDRPSGYGMAVYRDAQQLAGGMDAGGESRFAQETSVETYAARWQVRVWPTAQLLASEHPARARVPLLAGLTLALALGALVHAYQTSRRRTREAEEATRRLRAETAESARLAAAKRDSERLLDDIIDRTPAVVYVKDRDGRYLLVNRRFGDLFHTGTTYVKGRTDHDFFPREMADVFRANDLRVLESGVPIECEEVAPHDDGPHTYVSVKFPLLDARGEIYAVCGISTDLTDYKRTKGELLEAQQRLQLAADCSNIGFFDWDLSSGEMHYSRGGKGQLGYEEHEIADRAEDWQRLIHPEDRARVGARTQALLSDPRSAQETELRLRHKDGSYRWMLGRAMLLRDSDGSPVRMLGADIDITERKRAEEEIRRLNEDLEQRVRERTRELETANQQLATQIEERQMAEQALKLSVEQLERASRLKSEFLAAISHELRTPLNAIIGFTGLLLEGEFGSVGDGQKDALQSVHKAGVELFELISETLDLSRLEAGREPVAFEEVSLGELLREVESETEELRSKPGITSTFRVCPDLPAICTDPRKLKVVLKNLISNAVKFTERGAVAVEAGPCGGGVEISVADTGIGIPPDVVPIIFEAFRQGDGTSTRRYGGVGLGLHVARRFLELIGGTIEVGSRVGLGSTFRVSLPLDPAAGSREHSTVGRENGGPRPFFPRRSVLRT